MYVPAPAWLANCVHPNSLTRATVERRLRRIGLLGSRNSTKDTGHLHVRSQKVYARGSVAERVPRHMISPPKPTLERWSLKQWQSFEAQHAAPIFHARLAWAVALHDTNPEIVPAPHVLRLPSGETVFLPLVRSSGGRLPWRCFEGVPQGHNVFLTMDGKAVEGELLREALDALSRCSVDSLVLNLWPALNVLKPPNWSARYFSASVLDLSLGAEAALARMSSVARRLGEHSRKAGIVCFPQSDAGAVHRFYDLQPERWAKTHALVGQRFLHTLVKHAPRDVEIWFAYHEGRAIAGAVVLFGSHEAYIWLTAVVPDVMPLRPLSLMHMCGVQAAAARGLRWYNLGSSENLPDVQRLKAALGAPAVPFARLTLEKGVFRLYRQLRNRRAAQPVA